MLLLLFLIATSIANLVKIRRSNVYQKIQVANYPDLKWTFHLES